MGRREGGEESKIWLIIIRGECQGKVIESSAHSHGQLRAQLVSQKTMGARIVQYTMGTGPR